MLIHFLLLFNLLKPYEIYNGIRPLGMGNSGLAFLDDENVNFYNPAGISLRPYYSKTETQLINPSLGINKNIINSFSNILSGLNGISDFIKEESGKNYHTNFNIFPNFSTRNMSFGILLQANLDALNTGTYFEGDLNNPVFKINNTYDIIPCFTIGMPLFSSIVKAGISSKIIWRAEFNEELPYQSMVNLSFHDDLKEGFALAVDAGIILTAPIMYLPSLALVARNIGNSKFYYYKNIMSSSSDSVPDTILQTYDLAYGMYFILLNDTKLRFAFDYRDILNNYNKHWSQHIHTGAELSFFKSQIPFLQIRTGFSQLRWSLGFGLKSKTNGFDFAFYAKELGNSLREKSDYRYISRYVFNL